MLRLPLPLSALLLLVTLVAAACGCGASRTSTAGAPGREAPAPGASTAAAGMKISFASWENNDPRETDVRWRTRDEIAAYRSGRVRELFYLDVFPADYEPRNLPNSRSLYGGIGDGLDWTDAAFYIKNPYYLIGTAWHGTIDDFAWRASKGKVYPELVYEGRTATVRYTGQMAAVWRYMAFVEPPFSKGYVFLVTVNAYDAGFCWGMVDGARSRGLDPSWTPPPGSMVLEPCAYHWQYHPGAQSPWGTGMLNNLSPNDEHGKVQLLEEGPVELTVKLWREQPASGEAKEDMLWRILVEDVKVTPSASPREESRQ